jgi:hypothetical protein
MFYPIVSSATEEGIDGYYKSAIEAGMKPEDIQKWQVETPGTEDGKISIVWRLFVNEEFFNHLLGYFCLEESKRYYNQGREHDARWWYDCYLHLNSSLYDFFNNLLFGAAALLDSPDGAIFDSGEPEIPLVDFDEKEGNDEGDYN